MADYTGFGSQVSLSPKQPDERELAELRSQLAAHVAQRSGVPSQDDLIQRLEAQTPAPYAPVPFDPYAGSPPPGFAAEAVSAAGERPMISGPRTMEGLANQRVASWHKMVGGLSAGEARADEEYAEQAASDAAAHKAYISTPEGQFDDANRNRPFSSPHKVTKWGVDFPIGDRTRPISERPIIGWERDGDTPIYDETTPVEHPWAQLGAEGLHAAGYMTPLALPLLAADVGDAVRTGDWSALAFAPLGALGVGMRGAKTLAKTLPAAAAAITMRPGSAEGADYGSKLKRIAEQMNMGGAQSLEQITRSLRNAGVKQEELDWVLRVNELERGTKMSKEELLGRIDQNRIQPNEIVRGSDTNKVSDEDLYNEAALLREQFVDDTIGRHLDELFDDEWNRARMPEVTPRQDGTFDVHDYNGELLGNYSTRGRATLARDEADDLERAALDERIRGNESEARRAYEERYSDDDDFMDEARERLAEDADNAPGDTEFGDYKLDDGENYQELTISLPKSARKATGMEPYRGGHFKDAPDTVAHARTQERRLQDGNSFHVDEVQSDLHQAARSARKEEGAAVAKRMQQEYGGMSPVTDERNAYGTKLVPSDYGYLTPAKKAAYDEALAARTDARTLAERTASEFYSLRVAREGAIARDLDDTSGEWSALDRENWVRDRMRRDPELADAERRMDDARNAIPPMPEGTNIPDAPLKMNWHEMAFRRLLNEASQRGFSDLTWTSGKQQVDRYGSALRDKLDELRWEKTPDGVHLIGNKYDSEVLNTRYGEDKLSDVVGSAMAKRITEDTGQSGVIRGDDITIDDQGMSGFYDGNLRKYVQGIAKKYNSKVTKHIMPNDPNYYAGRSTDPSSNHRFVVRDKKTGEVVSGHEDLDAAHEAAADLGAEYVHRLRMSPELQKAIADENSGLKDFFKDGGRVINGDLNAKVDALEKRGYADGGLAKAAGKALTGGAKAAPKRARTPLDLEAELAALEAQNPRAVIGDNGGPPIARRTNRTQLTKQLEEQLVPNTRTGNIDLPFSRRMQGPDYLEKLRGELRTEQRPGFAPHRPIDIQDLQGAYVTGLSGDRSGVHTVLGTGSGRLAEPEVLHGGEGYMRNERTGVWANAKTPADRIAKKADTLPEGPRSLFMLSAMGGESTDYQLASSNLLQKYINPSKISRADDEKVSAAINALVSTKEFKKLGATADFPGLLSPDLDAWLAHAPNRYAAMKELDKSRWHNGSLISSEVPDPSVIRHAIQHPMMRGLPNGTEAFAGQVVGETTPGTVARLTSELGDTHPTFTHDIPGVYLGGLETPIPRSLIWRDWYDGRRAAEKLPGGDNKAFERSMPTQLIDQRVVDDVKGFEERLKSEGDIDDLLGRYEKGGVVKSIAKQLQSPTPKRVRETFDDWQWRPADEVRNELGLTAAPPHVEDFGRFMKEQQARARAGDMTARDLLKAYAITVSSMGRGAVNAELLAKRGHPTEQTGLVRPEGAMGDWLMAPAGRAYLDAAERGAVDRAALEDLRSVSHSFGKQNMLVDQLTGAASTLPDRTRVAIDAIARGDVDSWRRITSDLPGIDSAKSGFLGAPLGFGKLPTADAREVKLHTGLSTKETAKLMGRKGWADATVNRIAGRQAEMDLRLDPSLEDFRQHLTHHTVWDKVADEKTTHADLMRAMRLAGAVPAAALGAASYGDEAQAAEPSLDDIRAYLSEGNE